MNKFLLRHKISVLIIGSFICPPFHRRFTLVHSILRCLFSSRLVLSLGMRQLYSSSIYTLKLRITISRSYFCTTFPRLSSNLLILFSYIFSYRDKLSLTCSIQIFENLHFTKKSRLNVAQGQTSQYDRLANTHQTLIDVLIMRRRLSVSLMIQCSGHLQKIAADLTLSTTQNSQPCKIVTLSLNSNQNLHTTAP